MDFDGIGEGGCLEGQGWSLGQIARTDPGYLQWLDAEHDAPDAASDAHKAGAYLGEIDVILRRMGLRREPARSGMTQPRARFSFRR